MSASREQQLKRSCGSKLPRYLLFSVLIHMPCLAQATDFNADNAWNYLQAQCAFGPRAPGTLAHQKGLDYLENELKKYADTVERQVFYAPHPTQGNSVRLTNLIGHFKAPTSRRLLLCAHWDSRPWADHDPDLSNRAQPLLGANDGASGVAVLLEIARCLKLKRPGIGVDVVLFDGEDMGREGSIEEYLLGSREYVRHLKMPLPEAAILLDMVGDQDLHIPQEAHSTHVSQYLLDEVFTLAQQLGESAFEPRPGSPVYDDHIPLIEAGIPAIDLIDFDYPPWHTLQDTPDHCSPESLESVGRVVLAWIYQRGGK